MRLIKLSKTKPIQYHIFQWITAPLSYLRILGLYNQRTKKNKRLGVNHSKMISFRLPTSTSTVLHMCHGPKNAAPAYIAHLYRYKGISVLD